MEFEHNKSDNPPRSNPDSSAILEPPNKRVHMSDVPDSPHLLKSARMRMRHIILHKLSEPTLFQGGCNWPCLKWNHQEWARLFEEELTFRVGPMPPGGMPLARPVLESQCMKASLVYSQFLEWSKGQRSCLTLCKNDITSSQYWGYFDYVYMKDLYNIDLISGALLDWGIFGFPERGAEQSTLWIGTKGANTPCHIDTYGCNLVAQVMGRKRWVLFPRSQSPLLYPTRVPYEESSIYSEVGFPRPSPRVHPKLSSATPYVVTLEPGDVLFVPKHWWHSVENLDFSISINTWLELPSDSEERVKESLVAYQASSLCQGVHSPTLLASLFNPNMMDMATLTPTEHLDLLIERLFGPSAPEDEMCLRDKRGKSKDDCVFNQVCHSGEQSEGSELKVDNFRDNDDSLECEVNQIKEGIVYQNEDKVFKDTQLYKDAQLSMKAVPCISFSEYIQLVYGAEGDKIYANPNGGEPVFSENAAKLKQMKILIDAFTDQRVIDIIKQVIDEKLEN